MAVQQGKARLVIRLSEDGADVSGLWWPRGRGLTTELPLLFASWPPTHGHIVALSYSVPDWDDRPAMVAIPNRRGLVPTNGVPEAPRHSVLLTMLNGVHRRLALLPPGATDELVSRTIHRLGLAGSRPDWAPRPSYVRRPRDSR